MMMYCQKCRQPVVKEDEASPVCPFCDSQLVPRKVFSSGDVIAGFTIVRELGHGGMGVVYLAEQTNLNRFVALKVLEETLAGDQEFVKSFFREAGAAAKMAHPNIVQAYDAGIDNGVCYFVMELIQGQNLDDYVAQNGPMQPGLLLNVAVYIADALTYAWERNHLCHGDIKPENIIMQENGEIKLADLGLARDQTYDSLVPGEIMATPAYAPPEVIRGEVNRINFKADMYSFGTTLYHLAAGAPPFPDEDPKVVCAQQLNNQPKPLIAVDCNIPEELSVLVDQLMEKSPDHRPYSWALVTQKLMTIRRDYNLLRAKNKQENNAAQDIAENLPRKTFNKYTWAVFILTAVVCFLIAALLTVHYISSSASDKAQTAASSMNQTVWNQWLNVKQEIKDLTHAQALQKIQQFTLQYKNAPQEALLLQKSYTKLADFEKKIAPFLKNKKVVLQAQKHNIGTRPHEHPVIAKQQLDMAYELLRRQRAIQRYAKLIELESVNDKSLLSGEEILAIERYCENLERNISSYPVNVKKHPQLKLARLAEQESRYLIQSLKFINSYTDMVRFAWSLRDFNRHRLNLLPQYKRAHTRDLEIIAVQSFFVNDSQYLINMKKYLVGRMISNDQKIMDITEKGILCFSQKANARKLIPWNRIYDFWLDPSLELLSPAVVFMTENDAVQFYARSLIRRKDNAYYQNLLTRFRQISDVKRARLRRITPLFLNTK